MAGVGRWQAVALAAVAVAAAVIALLLLRTDDTTPPRATHPEPPAEARSLLAPEDLPGTGWRLSAERTLLSFAEAPEAFIPAAPELPECHALRTFEAGLLARDGSFRSGALRTLSRGDDVASVVRLTLLRVTVDSPEAASAIVAAAELALSGTGLGDCITGLSRRANLEIAVEYLTPPAVPANGVSQLMRLNPGRADIVAPIQGTLWWSSGPSFFAVSIVAAGEVLSEEDARAVAAAAVARSRP